MSFQDVRILSRGGGGGAVTTPPPLSSSSPTWKRRQLAAQARSVRVAALSGTQSENVERRDPPRPPPPPAQRSSRPFVLHGKVQKGWSMNSSSGSVLDEEYDDDDDDGDDDNNDNDNDDETLEETGDKSYAPSPHHSRHQSSRKVDVQTRQMNKAQQEMRSVLQLQKRRDFVRKSQQRKSVYAVLQNETQQFQSLVTELESALQSSGESPEQAWRARILMRTAQDSDHDLWKRLYCYEQTLMVRSTTTTTTPAPAAAGGGSDGVPQHRDMSLSDGNQVDDDDNNNNDEEKEEIEVRAAQTACLKLHRDFKRSHRALMMLLTTHEQRQRAEISTLGAVGWSGDFWSKQHQQQHQQQQQQEHHDMAWAHDEQQRQQEEDFFDRAMRERQAEVDHIHSSMIKVNEIYRDLATLVNHQQDDIDQLDDDIVDAKENVERGYNESSCMSDSRDRFCGVMDHLSPDDNSWTDWPLIGLSATTRSTTEEATTTTATTANNNTSMKRSNPADEGWALPTPEMRISETFHWLMPFETFTEDIKLVKLDIVALGQDIVNKGQNKLQCKPSTYDDDDDDDTEVDEENDDEQDDSIQT